MHHLFVFVVVKSEEVDIFACFNKDKGKARLSFVRQIKLRHFTLGNTHTPNVINDENLTKIILKLTHFVNIWKQK